MLPQLGNGLAAPAPRAGAEASEAEWNGPLDAFTCFAYSEISFFTAPRPRVILYRRPPDGFPKLPSSPELPLCILVHEASLAASRMLQLAQGSHAAASTSTSAVESEWSKHRPKRLGRTL